jgi:hypothetical protein
MMYDDFSATREWEQAKDSMQSRAAILEKAKQELKLTTFDLVTSDRTYLTMSMNIYFNFRVI